MPSKLKNTCSANPDLLFATVLAIEILLEHNSKVKAVWQNINWDSTGYFLTIEILMNVEVVNETTTIIKATFIIGNWDCM